MKFGFLGSTIFCARCCATESIRCPCS